MNRGSDFNPVVDNMTIEAKVAVQGESGAPHANHKSHLR